MKKIISIQGRSGTGISRPFLCEDAEGQSFFVKRSNVTWDQLVKEWVIGRLAVEFGLPVAPFEQVLIVDLLARQCLARDRHDFEPGVAFASQRVPFGEEVSASHIRHVPDTVKMAVFCFDWWTGNPDRRMGPEIFSSPNMIWDPVMQSIQLIDHDLSLDFESEVEDFHREHIFRDIRPFITEPELAKLRTRFESAIYNLQKIWDGLPPEWLSGESGEFKANLTCQKIESLLMKPGWPVQGLLS